MQFILLGRQTFKYLLYYCCRISVNGLEQNISDRAGRSVHRMGNVAKKKQVSEIKPIYLALSIRGAGGVSVSVRTRKFLLTGNTTKYNRGSLILIRRYKQ